MAYNMDYLVNLINQNKDTNPALAFALYNGFSGMGGGQGAGGYAGGLDTALRQAWGTSAATQWVNNNDTKYGAGTLFDPTTGKWSGIGQANGQGGQLAGWDPTQYNPGSAGSYTGTNNYTAPAALATGPAAPSPLIGGTTPPAAGGGVPAPTGGGTRTPGGDIPPPLTGAPTTPTTRAAPFDPTAPLGATRPPNGSGGINPGGLLTPNAAATGKSPTGYNAAGTTRTAPPTPLTPGGFPMLPNSAAPGANTRIARPDAAGAPLPLFTNAPTPYGGTPPAGSTRTGGAPTTNPVPTPSPAPAPTAPGTGANGDFTQADPTIAALIAALQRPAGSGNPFDFYNDEGYQFRKSQGMDKVQNSAAAGGMLNSGQTLKDLASFNSGLASEEYDKAYSRYDQNRKYLEDQYRYTNDDNYKRALQQKMLENDNYWKALGFNEDQRRDARNFDRSSFTSDRDYQAALDRWEREFGYKTDSGDRDRQTQTLLELVRNGLLGTQGSGNLAQILAALFGQNTMTGAGAGAAGQVGGANDINAILSQLLKYFGGQAVIPRTP